MSTAPCIVWGNFWGLRTLYLLGWQPGSLQSFKCPDCGDKQRIIRPPVFIVTRAANDNSKPAFTFPLDLLPF
jgi:hypothetical protein